MSKKRPRSVILNKGLNCFNSAVRGGELGVLTSKDYPGSVVKRFSFDAGGGLKWTLSALKTPRIRPAPWKIVVITGAPS